MARRASRRALLLLVAGAGVGLSVHLAGAWVHSAGQAGGHSSGDLRRDGRVVLRSAARGCAATSAAASRAGCPERGAPSEGAGSVSRNALVAAAALAAAVLVAVGRPVAVAAKELDIYFGVGNFFNLQHELVIKEASALLRRGVDITAVAGYAGGAAPPSGTFERICYSKFPGGSDHRELGQAEVVRVTLPDDRLADFAKAFLDEVPKRKPFENSDEFRPVIGLRGGMTSKAFGPIQQAGEGRAQFVEGLGEDKDTLGAKPSDVANPTVYVYDLKAFPFRPAEVRNQFKSPLPEFYDNDYLELNDKLKAVGLITSTGCP
mmetsp:Transcript_2987/g.8988  ORF Transcript_2987/g.8988 Transcript_2987/m.8988 type:complete len:319 (-) Transcript_2987:56-1012(-)